MEDFFEISNHHKYFKQSKFTIPTWDSIINNFDRNVRENLPIKVMNNFGIVTHDTSDIIEIHPIFELLEKKYPHLTTTAHAYVSFSSQSFTFGKHKDNTDVWVWGCIGITKWVIFDDEVHEYYLYPGDMIYVPRNMYHDTCPITPRASISFGVD